MPSVASLLQEAIEAAVLARNPRGRNLDEFGRPAISGQTFGKIMLSVDILTMSAKFHELLKEEGDGRARRFYAWAVMGKRVREFAYIYRTSVHNDIQAFADFLADGGYK